MTNTLAPTPICQAIVDNCGRTYRCSRPAARKHDYRWCGHHAPQPPRCGGNSTQTYHRTDCAGCGWECCQDRSQCVPGRCFIQTADGWAPASEVVAL